MTLNPKPYGCQHALLVLIQHNCILPRQSANNGEDVSYAIELTNVMHRLRYPRFLLHVKECMSKTHQLLLEGLLEHGRLRSSQLFARANACPDYDDDMRAEHSLDKAFALLVEGRFVERVPVGYQTSQNDDGAGEMHKQGSPKRRAEAPAGTGGNAAKGAPAVRAAASALSMPDLPGDRGMGGGEDDTLWRINPDEFNRRFRHVACAALVREKIDEDAGHLLLSILEITRTHETKVNEERSTPVSEADILANICGGGTRAEIDQMKGVLGRLVADTSELISCVGVNPKP